MSVICPQLWPCSHCDPACLAAAECRLHRPQNPSWNVNCVLQNSQFRFQIIAISLWHVNFEIWNVEELEALQATFIKHNFYQLVAANQARLQSRSQPGQNSPPWEQNSCGDGQIEQNSWSSRIQTHNSTAAEFISRIHISLEWPPWILLGAQRIQNHLWGVRLLKSELKIHLAKFICWGGELLAQFTIHR